MQLAPRALTATRIRAARSIAIAADFLQIVVFPVFAGGAASIVNDILDVAVAVSMSLLVGWHWAFLPSFLAELVPFFDLVPTWTAAVFFATRKGTAQNPAGGAGPVIDTEVVKNQKPAGGQPGRGAIS
ncbi:MAG TPA: hypothetical protein VEO37_06255 [Thermoanaerobaculia bacterium]|nr:hypothetical protein [Thermoanaerobaculia bacterium]